MGKIDTITPAQWRDLIAYRDQKLREALRTDSIDHEEAREAVRELYLASGLESPRLILILQSPLQCLLARGLLLQISRMLGQAWNAFYSKLQLKNQVQEHLADGLWDQLVIQIGYKLNGWLYIYLRDRVVNRPLWRQLKGQLIHQLQDQLGAQLIQDIQNQLEVQLITQILNQIEDQLWGHLVEELHVEPASQLGRHIDEQLKDEFIEEFIEQLRDQLWSQLSIDFHLRDKIWRQFQQQLIDQIEDHLTDQLMNQIGEDPLYQVTWFTGGWDYSWLCLYDGPRRIGVHYPNGLARRLDAHLRYADTCGVSYLYPGAAFVSDRPERIKFDSQYRLHADDGPALRWRDGFAIYAWRGIRVAPEVIERRRERTAAEVLVEPNAELRRVLMEIYAHVHGPERFLSDLGAMQIAEDTVHGQPRRLYQVGGMRFLAVTNGSLERDGTRRQFLLGAAPDADTPHAAVAASYGRPARRYREAVRT